MRVTLFDYGAGNLHSLGKALRADGRSVHVQPDPRRAIDTDVLVLPGVGAFGAAAAALAPGRAAMRAAIAGGLPTLGICLGMQLMFESSAEGDGDGLGLFAGRVERVRAKRSPQIGWNAIEDVRDPLFAPPALTTAYYANGYVCRPVDSSAVIAWSTHETDRFPAAVRLGRTVGVQFHPEKSSAAGLEFLRRYLDEVAA
ncbi:MAG: imidazole glycerol phosphate synthase subunit HisH [Gemmatimonadetes bacterium]|nr:imidazole glycerol phosphate synthase subunit HisH [Gemmatimonadota bacterium]MBI3504599.1 imidazole glycerol phosphate synthase subunit HisH [Pseudomonadota bacterium]